MSRRRPCVLVVDDLEENVDLLAEMLGDEYQIASATSGPEALVLASTQLPDLILLDVAMPGMDGYGVCSRLKANPATRSIPVIFVTALTRDDQETRGLAVGAIDYITKPLRPAVVQARVRNHLELKRHRDHLEQLSATDSLTGLANRRRFDDALDREWRRAIRGRTRISLIGIDIDFFKQFNDHYGHLAGDGCLKKIATVLSETARRASDLVARCGGEEFACLLPETDHAGALCVANRIRGNVEALAIPHAHSAAADHVTLSFGVATTVPAHGQAASTLVQRADALLYEAKRNGRNQVRGEADQT